MVDASFKKQEDRLAALELARRNNADFLLIECRCPEEEIRRRLAVRGKDRESVSDGRWSIFPEQKKDFDRVTGLPGGVHLTLNTKTSGDLLLAKFFDHLLHRSARALAREIESENSN